MPNYNLVCTISHHRKVLSYSGPLKSRSGIEEHIARTSPGAMDLRVYGPITAEGFDETSKNLAGIDALGIGPDDAGKLLIRLLNRQVPNGGRLYENRDPVSAQQEFEKWIGAVGAILDRFPDDRGLRRAWDALPTSKILVADKYLERAGALADYWEAVRTRLDWLCATNEALGKEEPSFLGRSLGFGDSMFVNEETAKVLLKNSGREIESLIKSGELREFREGSRPMFKRDQVYRVRGANTPVPNGSDNQGSEGGPRDSITPSSGYVFIGHGRSNTWLVLRDFLEKRLNLAVDEFNRESTAGMSIKERLEAMLQECCFAFLVLTAEDERSDGTFHARENVVHEVGLFQGRLGFGRAIILLENGCAKFTNIDGLTYIAFEKNDLRMAFEEIRRVLEREHILSN